MILYPDFDKIKELCRKKIEISYPKYGNSWANQQLEFFWYFRTCDEFRELNQATANDKSKIKEEIIDCINVLTMWHQSLD